MKILSQNNPFDNAGYKVQAAGLGLFIIAISIFPGCSSPRQAPPATAAEPSEVLAERLSKLPTVERVESWALPQVIRDRSARGLKISTRHYEIFSTMEDPLLMVRVPFFLESAFAGYNELVKQSVEGRKKLSVYLFNTREQWEDFTRLWTGVQAETYLKLPSGAYYAERACVAYHINRGLNFSILAHEGWHQYVDEYFAFQAPSWINEGVATGFESFEWENGRVVFKPEQNGSRLLTLRQALMRNKMIPLTELIKRDPGYYLESSDAGVSEEGFSRMGGYYAQVYALVRFFREAGQGIYLQSFIEMLSDGFEGGWPLSSRERFMAIRTKNNLTRGWNERVGPLLLETYFKMTSEGLEPSYRAYCRKIAATIH